VRQRLRGAGFAVRRGDTFPGLGPDWLRVAVRDRATNDRFVTALRQIMKESDHDADA
jgi:histidinol-phosphate aminotransferase